MRIAILGAGRIATVHAASIVDHPDAELALVVDPVEEAARALGAVHGVPWSLDAEDVFEAGDVDAVLIASPTPTHAEYIVRAVQSDKKVLCEKPIALALDVVDETWAAIEHRAPFVMLAFNRRFDPSLRELAERQGAGEIGTVRQVTMTSRDPAGPPEGYLASSGGGFKDQAIHDFDMARFLLGEIVEVTAMTSTNDLDVYERLNDHAQAMTLLRAESGALCTIINSRDCAFGHDQRVEVFGDAGSLRSENHLESSVRVSTGAGTDTGAPVVQFFLERYGAAYRAEMYAFIKAAREDRPPPVTYEDGRRALLIAEAARESVATGRIVRVGD